MSDRKIDKDEPQNWKDELLVLSQKLVGLEGGAQACMVGMVSSSHITAALAFSPFTFIWIIDLGATDNMTGKCSRFQSCALSAHGCVKIVDGTFTQVVMFVPSHCVFHD